jgi:hypothetical protein
VAGILGRNICKCLNSAVAPKPGNFAKIQHAADRRQHAQRQDVDLHQAQRVEVVLVPLDHAALRHRRVFHRHQAGQRPREMTKAADVLRQMARKAAQGLGHGQPLLDARRPGSRPSSAKRSGSCSRLSHQASEAVSALIWAMPKAERPTGVAQRALGAVGDQRRGQRRPLAAVFGVDVLDHLLAPLVLEIDVDVRRLAALLRDEALEQQAARAGSTSVTPSA